MDPLPQARSAKRRSYGLALCLGLALSLHAVLLAWPARTSGARHGAPVSLAVRLLSVMPTQAEVENVANLSKARLEAMPAMARTESLATAPTLIDAHEDAQAPLLSSPDAALPGGRAQARVWLAVEADGYVRDLRVEPEVLPRAFERAIERAFTGSRVPVGQVRLRGGTVCVEVQFKEGEQPSWQAVEPAGICLA